MSTAMERQLLEELRRLNERMDRIENLIEEKLVGTAEPLPDEKEATQRYDEEKGKGKTSCVKLEDVCL